MSGLADVSPDQRGEAYSTASLCSVANRCGGCPRISRTSLEQREEKLAWVTQLLSGLNARRISWHPARSPDAYRNRIRLRIFASGRPGFFNPEKSPSCVVLRPELARLLEEVQGTAQDAAIFQHFSHLELRVPDRDERPTLFLGNDPRKANPKQVGPSKVEFDLFLRRRQDWLIGASGMTDPLEWPRARYESLDGLSLFVPVGSFMQVNDVINQHLVATIRERALERGIATVSDLYCGSGNFLLPLANEGLTGVGVESDPRSIEAARHAARAANLSVSFSALTTEQWLNEQLMHRRPPSDLVLVDPPRAGLGRSASSLAAWAPRAIAYCSCNPKSLVADLRVLLASGYRLEDVLLLDMFPHTEHVEVLTWLQRG